MNPMTHLLAQAATNLALTADLWSGWSIFESPRYEQLHARLVARLGRREAMPLREIEARHADRAAVLTLSQNFTRPIVVRGALAGEPHLENFGSRQWWVDRCGDTEVLCSSNRESHILPMREALAREEFYLAGPINIFFRHPELREMMENDVTRAISPEHPNKPPNFYQLFLGRSRQGTTIHCAAAINVFRQLSGRKKWFFLAPDQTPYLRPKVYSNGFAATSLTIQPHGDEQGSPWFDRLERYTVTIDPGDLVINPPWWWHGVENLPSDALIAGVAARYRAGGRVLRTDAFKTMLAFTRIVSGRSEVKKIDVERDPEGFERSVIGNRAETGQQLILEAR